MENRHPQEKELDRLVAANNIPGAVRLLVELIEQQARERNFTRAELLRERLMALDDMALTEIIRTAEIIEAAKSSALDRDHRALFAPLYDGLNEEETNALFFGMQTEDTAAGQILYRQGEPNGRLFFLNQGRLNLFFTRKAKDNLISTLEPGAIAGQDSFLRASFATTSLAAETDARLQVLDDAAVAGWKGKLPGLIDKLEQFCHRRSIGDLFAAKGMERRAGRRLKVEGPVVAQIIDGGGKPAGKPFRGDLSDLANSGTAFFIKATDRAARMLLGRRLQMRLTIQTPERNRTVTRKGLVVAVYALYIGDHAIHLRFDTPLKSS